jgi:ATP-binding protein involved in chromosome partitioning
MTVTKELVLQTLAALPVGQGGSLMARDLVRALDIQSGLIRFVVEAESAEAARAMEPERAAAEAALRALPGVTGVSAVLTAHGPSGTVAKSPPAAAPRATEPGAPPSLTIGRHPTPQAGPQRVTGVDRILAIGSGKGGVGKSTVSSNLAVALARAGRRVGLLDADIYGPSQPRMMGVTARPASPDGKIIMPLHAHGVTMMSIGLMLKDGEAVVWRGPMLLGALQ